MTSYSRELRIFREENWNKEFATMQNITQPPTLADKTLPYDVYQQVKSVLTTYAGKEIMPEIVTELMETTDFHRLEQLSTHKNKVVALLAASRLSYEGLSLLH